MIINPKIRSSNSEVDTYIQELEDWITNFKASNIFKLVSALDETAGTIADDIIMISKNKDDEELDGKVIMLGSKKNKMYQRYREVISDIKHFKTISDILEEIKPKAQEGNSKSTGESKTDTEKLPKRKVNIQDFALESKV